jgi:hypothetical protein
MLLVLAQTAGEFEVLTEFDELSQAFAQHFRLTAYRLWTALSTFYGTVKKAHLRAMQRRFQGSGFLPWTATGF